MEIHGSSFLKGGPLQGILLKFISVEELEPFLSSRCGCSIEIRAASLFSSDTEPGVGREEGALGFGWEACCDWLGWMVQRNPSGATVCVCLCVCVCLRYACVKERAREKEKERERHGQRDRDRDRDFVCHDLQMGGSPAGADETTFLSRHDCSVSLA